MHAGIPPPSGADTPQSRHPPGPGTSPGHGTPRTRYHPSRPGTPQDKASPWAQAPPVCSACWEIWTTSGRYASYWNAILLHDSLLPAMKFGQGYVFTGVCDSVHRGGTWPGTPPRTRYTPLGAGTPQDQVPPSQAHPPDQVHTPSQEPQTRYTPHPRPGTPPGTRYTPPWPGTPPPRPGTPPRDQVHPPGPGRYGLRAGGTHPTGMQSCLNLMSLCASKDRNDRL